MQILMWESPYVITEAYSNSFAYQTVKYIPTEFLIPFEEIKTIYVYL